MNYIIITGASKGLGEGIARALLSKENHLICISRTESIFLKEEAEKNTFSLDQILFDLSFTIDIQELMAQVFEIIKKDKAKSLILINNAGLIKPVGPVEDGHPDEVETHLKVNLLAPMLLTREFVKLSKQIKCEKRILNISSGAAQNPYFGWSSYCTGKAGIEMFTKCLALEQEREKYPAKIMALAPGIIETDMQSIIRSTTEEQFPLKSKFVELKETGKLVPPALAGEKIAKILLGDQFENGKIIDIR